MINEEAIKKLILEYRPDTSEEELEQLSNKVISLLIIDAYNIIRTLE